MKRILLYKAAAVVAMIGMMAACSDEDEFTKESQLSTRSGEADSLIVSETPVLPAKQLRAVWIATVYEIDWPAKKHTQTAQKRLYIKYLDSLKANNFNAVFFQVRPMADAFYDSEFEPWSEYITGTAGKDPGYDVLKFLIDEAHKRCISFHAWMNPYRIAQRSSTSTAFPTLDSRIPKDLVKEYNLIRVYNPALPATRARIDSIVEDIITKYDVDGIHFDDYFYTTKLTSGESYGDDAEYAQYGSGFSNIDDWRRENVNLLVRGVQSTISNTRPGVVFSIAPQGNVENDYNGQRADVMKWMKQGWLDLMIPEIYYQTDPTNYYYFNKRVKQWAQNATNCNLAIGYGLYRFDPSSTVAGFRTNAMLQEQFDLADATNKSTGDVFYNTTSFMNNKCNVDSVIRVRYAQKALLPFYGRYTPVKPATPAGVTLVSDSVLTWDAVNNAYYAVYRSNGDKQVATLVEVTNNTSFPLTEEGNYFVTAVSKDDNAESPISVILKYQKQEQTNGIHEITMK